MGGGGYVLIWLCKNLLLMCQLSYIYENTVYIERCRSFPESVFARWVAVSLLLSLLDHNKQIVVSNPFDSLDLQFQYSGCEIKSSVA